MAQGTERKKMSLFLETLKVYRDEISFTASKAQAQARFYIGLFRALMPPNLIWIKNCLKIFKYFCCMQPRPEDPCSIHLGP